MPPARLSPAYFEARPLPRELAPYSDVPDTLRAGAPGKVAILDLGFGPVDGRTELRSRYQKSPLQVMRPLYFDPERPDLAILIVMSTGAGMLQGDRYRIDAVCEAGSALHLTTQCATKVLRMDRDYATSVVNLEAGAGSLLEYLPDPIIPCAHSRSYHRTRVTLAEGATAIVGERIRAGRVAHGERHAYDVLAVDLEIRRPDGTALVVDRLRLEPDARRGGVGGPGMLGGHDQVATLHVLGDGAPAVALAEVLHERLEPLGVSFGVSTLPGGCGAWVRLLGSHSPTLDHALWAAYDASRRLLVGVPAPDLRKSTTFVSRPEG